MLDELRNHDSRPQESEREWMECRPLALLRKGAALAILAVLFGLGASAVVGHHAAPPGVTASVSPAFSGAANLAGSPASSR